MIYLSGDADDTAGRSRTSIAGLLTLLVSALAEIISACVDDDGSLEHNTSVSSPVPWMQIRDPDLARRQ